eukprot:TRINITY_DN34033_c0_g1_i1.p1 TRINITY_DN34033_c0_g1~~TRINITY_DN34033_c0_g1_i1.p1  ORF type:complete len:356 (+),score=40.04 TRINITY_DN34033_c0_g1_i1:28-1068(+)
MGRLDGGRTFEDTPKPVVKVYTTREAEKFIETKLLFFRVIDKITRAEKPQERVLLLTRAFLMVCEIGGRICRVLRIRDIEAVFYRQVSDKRGGSIPEVLVKSKIAASEPTLMLHFKSNGRSLDTLEDFLRVVWHQSYFFHGPDDSVLIKEISKDEHVRAPALSRTYGLFTKGPTYKSPKEKMLAWQKETPMPPWKPPREPTPEPEPEPEPEIIYKPPTPPPEPEPEPEPEPIVEVVEEHIIERVPTPPVAVLPPPPPPEPMMLIPADMLVALQPPAPIIRRKKKLKQLPGAPTSLRDNCRSINLNLYMHKPTTGRGATVVDNRIPAISPIAAKDGFAAPSYMQSRV